MVRWVPMMDASESEMDDEELSTDNKTFYDFEIDTVDS